MKTATFLRSFLVATAAFVAAASSVWAQDAAPAPVLVLELNGAQASDKGCRLTFVVTNNLGAELARTAFEIALFNQEGVVDRLTVLDFSELPAGKTKVARFDLAGADCARISGVLVNHATECTGPGIDPQACLRQLKPETKSGIAFGL